VIIISEAIGQRKYQIGPGVILLLPMLYAIIIGGIISFPKLKIISENELNVANTFLKFICLLLVARIGTIIGPSVVMVAKAGLALSLQELGHFFGTIFLGLPIAIFLGLKREAIGATFSIDREGGVALISEKYGLDSPEGRGVMATYICGTIFGALYMGLFAGFIASLKIFHPYALAMGAGVGSASMMAAATGAIAAVNPECAKEVLQFAAAANLLTTILAIYFTIFISLPVTRKLYVLLEPKIGRIFEKGANKDEKMV
jgi:hypothetical protein